MEDQEKVFIIDYFEKQVDDICSFMDSIPGRYRMKDIHQLRVRIKRLKAVFSLLEFMHPVEFRAKDHYHVYKAVFKSAGLIRESQINLGLLMKFKGTEKLYKSFSKYIAKLRPEWNTNLDNSINSFNYSRLEEIRKTLNVVFSRNTELELLGIITDFIYSELDRIKNLISESNELEYIHEVRIILKNIKPLLSILWTRDDSTFEKDQYSRLNSTETLIGNWHDRLVLSNALSMFFKAKGKEKEKLLAEYEVVQKKIQKNNRKALDKLAERLGETLDSFS
ncbi:MAG: CHAD domain-containing protein [Bacteroidales bacterium]|nr:CHAD domain-containing protein [Bacteroidales bacterium]